MQTKKLTIQEAEEIVPYWISLDIMDVEGNIQKLGTTPEYEMAWVIQRELDLYYEGEESDINGWMREKQALRAIEKLGYTYNNIK
jgi:hypothetical protein